jgi:hypothetical protein
MPKFKKGSEEMKEFMKMVRSKKGKKKGGDGFMGDVIKSVGKTALSYAPVPTLAKNIGEHILDYGVGKSGLGLKKFKKKYGSALLLP